MTRLLGRVGAGIGVLLVALTIVNLIPSRTVVQELVNLVWTNAAPYLVLLGAVGLVLAGVGVRRRSLGAAVVASLTVSLLGVVAPVLQVTRVVAATSAAGGSVNPVSALAVGLGRRAPDRTQTYATLGGTEQRARIWLPRPAGDGGTGGAPVLLVIHGGGWIEGNGDALTYSGWAASFADHGYLVVSLDYRLSTATHASWDESGPDVACGLVWTARHAAALGGDPTSVTVMGASAGGNLALNLAWSSAQGTARSSCGGTVPVPRAVVAYVPVVDPQGAYDRGVAFPGAAPRSFVRNYIGGDPSQHPDRMRAITTATYLSAAAPRTLVIEPDDDGYIPTDDVLAFARTASRAGVDLTLVRLPVVNHFAVDQNTVADQAVISIALSYLDRVPG